MMQVNFRLKNPEAKMSTSIIIDVTVQNRRIRRSIGLSVPPRQWSSRTQSVIGPDAEALRINTVLDLLRQEIWKLESESQLSGGPIRIETVLKIIHSAQKKKSDPIQPSNPETAATLLQRWISSHRSTRKEQTIKVWRTLRNHVIEFEGRKRSTLLPIEMDRDWAGAFVHFMRTDRKMCDSTIWKYLRAWKRFMRWLEDQGIPITDAYRKIGQADFRIQRSHAVRLTKEQLQKVYDVDLRNHPSANNARRLFVLQCCLGVRFNDLCRIVRRPDDFRHEGLLHLRTEKTDKVVVIPLLPMAKEILDGPATPIAVTNQEYNRQLKFVAQSAGLTDPVIRVKWYGGKSVEEHTRLCDLLSSHAAKRTFVTLMATAGVRTETIMKVTGNSRATIDAYVHLNEKDISDELLEKASMLFGECSDATYL